MIDVPAATSKFRKYGSVKVNTTVAGSGDVTVSSLSIPDRCRGASTSGLRIQSNVKTTSSAVSGVPSLNVTPSFRRNVIVSPSGLNSQSLAISGTKIQRVRVARRQAAHRQELAVALVDVAADQRREPANLGAEVGDVPIARRVVRLLLGGLDQAEGVFGVARRAVDRRHAAGGLGHARRAGRARRGGRPGTGGEGQALIELPADAPQVGRDAPTCRRPGPRSASSAA